MGSPAATDSGACMAERTVRVGRLGRRCQRAARPGCQKVLEMPRGPAAKATSPRRRVGLPVQAARATASIGIATRKLATWAFPVGPPVRSRQGFDAGFRRSRGRTGRRRSARCRVAPVRWSIQLSGATSTRIPASTHGDVSRPTGPEPWARAWRCRSRRERSEVPSRE